MTTQTQPWKTVSPFGRLVNAIAGMLVVRARARPDPQNRRDAAMLTGLDDRMLADIGLTRGPFAMPIRAVWRDPTESW